MTPKDKRRRSYQKGLWAELMAAALLFFKGYRILVWRYKTPVGEVDVIARKGGVLVFVEVKMRQRFEQSLVAVHYKNRQRIERAAQHFIARYSDFRAYDMRFDVIVVNRIFSMKHIDNAWRSGS